MRGHGELLRRDLGEFLPAHRRRDRGPGLGADAVGAGDRPVAGVLVVVDEDARAPLLLPPARGHRVGQPALERAAERDRRVAHIGERPARLDAHIDVDAAAARGLGKAAVAELGQQRPRLAGHPRGVGEVGAGLGIEVDAQLVRMIDGIGAHRPGVEGDRAHLGRPSDHRQLGRTDLVGRAAGRELDASRLDVVRCPLGDALLVEGVPAAALAGGEGQAGQHPLGPALERGRPVLECAHDAGADREVVGDDVELGERAGMLGRREDDAVGARHAQLATAGIDGDGVCGGHLRRVPARGSAAPQRTAAGRSASRSSSCSGASMAGASAEP